MPRQWINQALRRKRFHQINQSKTSTIYLLRASSSRIKISVDSEVKLRILIKRIGLKVLVDLQKKNLLMYGSYSKDFSSKEVLFSKLLKSMRDLAVANNSKFKISYMPANFEVYPELVEKILPGSRVFNKKSMPTNYGTRICKIASDINIQCLNITDSMLSNISSKGMSRTHLLKNNYFYPEHGEIHMSKSGAKFAGENIYSKLIKDDLH